MTTVPAGRALLTALADPEFSLSGERIKESDKIVYRLKRTVEHEVVRTTVVPDAVISGLVKTGALKGRETKKPGTALFLTYALATKGGR